MSHRYPLHHHLCGSVPANLVQKNSVHDCLQRCYVVHGTHNLTLSDNVAYNNIGEVNVCFYLGHFALGDIRHVFET